MANIYEHVTHTFEPIFDEHSQVLILGTFPSVKSRENQFYYGYPQNRFWKLLAEIFNGTVPTTIEEKKAFLLRHHIAIWDVVAKCDIAGSSDSSIRNVAANDLQIILKHAPIRQIFANGGKAYELYQKYAYGKTGREIIKLPSTSPANAAFSMDRLIQQWKEVRKYCQCGAD